MQFTQYNLSGKVVDQYHLDSFNELTSYPLGQKTRITMNDQKEYVDFWSEPFEPSAVKTIILMQYTLDENTGKLRSFDSSSNIIIFVPVDGIAKIEAILYSSPRWGTRPTNKFKFSKPVRRDLKSDFFKNWPKKKK